MGNPTPGSAFAGAAQGIESIVGAIGSLFGTSQSTSGTVNEVASSDTVSKLSGETKKRLELDSAAITRVIEEVLSGPEGLAAIFSGDKNAGIFDTTVSSQAAGNLAAKLVGELAKLTATEVSTTDQRQVQRTNQERTATSSQTAQDEGVLSGIGDFFKGVF